MPPFASPPATSAHRGSNQSGLRAHNERLLLSLIRVHRQMHRSDMARLTGLSMQTISIIVNQLVADGLLIKGEPQRGRVGQPSAPYSLNPDGALALGLKVGRRSIDLYLIDFNGRVIAGLHETYRYPTVPDVVEFTRNGIARIVDNLSAAQLSRICGIGIGAPFDMWMWSEEMGAPPEELDPWRTIDLKAEIARHSDWPVYFANDITAACAAELMFGRGAEFIDYLYVFIGSFIGGGLVLDGHLFPGRKHNAAALGSMPAFTPSPPGTQLVNVASIYVLERQLVAAGRDASMLWRSPADWGEDLGAVLDTWIDQVAENLALSISAAVAVIDVQTIIIDGAFPEGVKARIIAATEAAVSRLDRQGLSEFSLEAGTIGHAARAMGAASLPLLANFTLDREVLFKDNG
jgi:predicted NBD/HSP70 family sugar kinase